LAVVTAVYEQAGVTFDDPSYTFQGFGPTDSPSTRVEIGFTAPAYNQADYDYEQDVSYGSQIAALDPNPGWTDVTDSVSEVHIRRGNSNFLIRNVEAGSCTIIFEDPDSRWLPTNESSPYYPYVEPGRPIRVVAEWSDADTVLFRGQTARLIQNFEVKEQNTTVTMTCTDVLNLLQNYTVDQTLLGSNGETSAERINDLLDDTGPFGLRPPWPESMRSIDTNTSALVEQDAAGEKRVLDAIKLVTDSEWGLFFIDKQGRARFLGRDLANPGAIEALSPDFYFGYTATRTTDLPPDYNFVYGQYDDAELDYESAAWEVTVAQARHDVIETESADDTLTNVVEVTDAYGNIGGWKYDENIAVYEERRLPINTLLANVAAANDLGSFVLNNQYDPTLRAQRLGFYMATDTASTQAAVLSELTDTVGIKHLAPGSVEVDLLGVVSAIEHEIRKDFWYTTFVFGAGSAQAETPTVIGTALV
jgi:hypothetical protein